MMTAMIMMIVGATDVVERAAGLLAKAPFVNIVWCHALAADKSRRVLSFFQHIRIQMEFFCLMKNCFF